MYGPDVFAVTTAHDQKNKAGSAVELNHNSRWLCKAIGDVALEPTINSREITPAEDSQSDKERCRNWRTITDIVHPEFGVTMLSSFPLLSSRPIPS